MSSAKADLLHNLAASRDYRRSFIEEKVRTQLAIQVKTIREQRNMSRPTFASLLGKAASWVFRLEDPNQAPPTIPSLINVADALDVDLDIRFRPFSELLNQIEAMSSESFKVDSFDEELEKGAFDVPRLPKQQKAVAHIAAPVIEAENPLAPQTKLLPFDSMRKAMGGNEPSSEQIRPPHWAIPRDNGGAAAAVQGAGV